MQNGPIQGHMFWSQWSPIVMYIKTAVYTNSVRVTVVGDIKLQRSPLQYPNFIITLSLGFVLTIFEMG